MRILISIQNDVIAHLANEPSQFPGYCKKKEVVKEILFIFFFLYCKS